MAFGRSMFRMRIRRSCVIARDCGIDMSCGRVLLALVGAGVVRVFGMRRACGAILVV